MAAFQSDLNRTQINFTNRILAFHRDNVDKNGQMGLRMLTRQQNAGLIQPSEGIHSSPFARPTRSEFFCWASDQMT